MDTTSPASTTSAQVILPEASRPRLKFNFETVTPTLPARITSRSVGRRPHRLLTTHSPSPTRRARRLSTRLASPSAGRYYNLAVPTPTRQEVHSVPVGIGGRSHRNRFGNLHDKFPGDMEHTATRQELKARPSIARRRHTSLSPTFATRPVVERARRRREGQGLALLEGDVSRCASCGFE